MTHVHFLFKVLPYKKNKQTNKQINKGENITIPHRKIPVNKCRMNKGNIQSLLGKHNSNSFKQDQPMHGKISEWQFEQNRIFA